MVDYLHAGWLHSTIGDRYSSDARRIIEIVYRDGYDVVFWGSDEYIGIIAMNLFQQNMKLITANGVGDAMRHQPPISCVNHATQDTVKIMMDKLRLIAEGKKVLPEKIAVKPAVYVNETISLTVFEEQHYEKK